MADWVWDKEKTLESFRDLNPYAAPATLAKSISSICVHVIVRDVLILGNKSMLNVPYLTGIV